MFNGQEIATIPGTTAAMPHSEGRFANKVVLITGGSSGIGRAAALGFAREGARVVIAARGVERGQNVLCEIALEGGTAVFIPTDVSRADQVKQLFEQAIEDFGRLDCAFNNAAAVATSHLAATAELTEEQFDESIAVNLKSVWLCMKEEIQIMLSQSPRGGAIVNTSSVNGLGGSRSNSFYSAAKAGVLGLTKSAALEYASSNIRVNALAAGAFRTPMLEGLMDFLAAGDVAKREHIENRFNSLIALGRIGEPEEAAQAVLWLCSDAASYVTGNTMIVDGGLTSLFR